MTIGPCEGSHSLCHLEGFSPLRDSGLSFASFRASKVREESSAMKVDAPGCSGGRCPPLGDGFSLVIAREQGDRRNPSGFGKSLPFQDLDPDGRRCPLWMTRK